MLSQSFYNQKIHPTSGYSAFGYACMLKIEVRKVTHDLS
jgi:hypothetical protein